METPERLNLQSADLTADKIDALRSAFPEVFRDGKIDFASLQRSLGENVESGTERFGLSWPGKAECMRVIQTPSIGTLLPMPAESVDWDTTQNVIVEGDNLEVLKLLQKAYHGKVKLIYIDPPYNTGKEFVYPDNFSEGLADYLRFSGQVDGAGLKLSTNTDSDGRFHSKWLSMMYPRLFLARNLLAEDGVIFVSLDEHEIHHLRLLMNEVFGEENFVGQVCVVNNLKGRNDEQFFATAHEYLLVFRRDRYVSKGLSLTPEKIAEYSETTVDGRAFQWRDLRKRGGADTRTLRPNLYFPLYHDILSGALSLEAQPGTIPIFPKKSDGSDGCWRWGKSKVEQSLGELRATTTKDDDRWNISYRVYLDAPDGERRSIPKSVWMGPQYSTDSATKALRSLVPAAIDFTPKPVELLKTIVEMTTHPDSICLDFFAGSGTLGQAVQEVNNDDGGCRSFVLVQLPERSESVSIPVVMRERLRAYALREAMKDPELGAAAADHGFRSYRLSSGNFVPWDSDSRPPEQLQVELGALGANVIAGRTVDDIVPELLLKLGLPITTKVDLLEVATKQVHSIADGAVLFFLADRITIEVIEEMVSRDPTQIVILEEAFGGDDQLKVNAAQTVRRRAESRESEMALKVV